MILLLLLLGVLIALYFLGTRNFNYWKERNVVYDRPIPFFGNSFELITQKKSLGEVYTDMYNRYPEEKIVGWYSGNNPTLVLRDPDTIRHVLSVDFQNFHRRFTSEVTNIHDVEPLMRNVFSVDGDAWRLVRQRLTTAFSSGKLKAMYPLIVQTTDKLCQLAGEYAESGKEIDVRELMARYTTDFIGAVGFGLKTDALANEDSSFRKLGKRFVYRTKFELLKTLLRATSPSYFKNLKLIPDDLTEGIISLMKSVMEQRNNQPSGNIDFIDLLLESKSKGALCGDSIDYKNPDGTPKTVEIEWDDELMAAQVFVFYVAGFETSSSTSSMALHLLAYHPEEQAKCHKEIDEVLSRYDNKLCYDAVKEMTYLEQCFLEGMRLYPVVGILRRLCENKYKIPGTGVVIDKGVINIVPIFALHHDEKFFPEPEKFKPERFHPDNKTDIMKHVYLPFGNGPRACIGERLGRMQSLGGLAAVLSKFSVVPSESSVQELKFSKRPLLMPEGGLPLRLVARKKNI